MIFPKKLFCRTCKQLVLQRADFKEERLKLFLPFLFLFPPFKNLNKESNPDSNKLERVNIPT